MPGKIILGDNLEVLQTFESECVDLVYIDPPFNTGKARSYTRFRVAHDPNASRMGFLGRSYQTTPLSTVTYNDTFDDYLAFLRPRLEQLYRVLKPDGSLFFHSDYREVHYCKVLLDSIFGRESFKNEIIWAYDYGGKPKTRWPAKHDNILWYAKNPKRYTFNYEAIDRVPYLAPWLVSEEKAKRGKIPTDVWWQTIACGKERTGYPTQKPLAILERIIRVHTNPSDVVLDCFAGSGTTGEAAARLGCSFILIDNNPEAVEVMKERLGIEYVVQRDRGLD